MRAVAAKGIKCYIDAWISSKIRTLLCFDITMELIILPFLPLVVLVDELFAAAQ